MTLSLILCFDELALFGNQNVCGPAVVAPVGYHIVSTKMRGVHFEPLGVACKKCSPTVSAVHLEVVVVTLNTESLTIGANKNGRGVGLGAAGLRSVTRQHV